MYSPDQITKLGLILDTKFKPSLHKVYRLVKTGKLPAIDMSSGEQPRLFIEGKDLRRYVEEVFLKIKKEDSLK